MQTEPINNSKPEKEDFKTLAIKLIKLIFNAINIFKKKNKQTK